MDGLLTVTHHSVNESDMMSMQADLPLLSEHDVHAIRDITSSFEVDFVALTFTRDGEDVESMRDFLDKLGLEQTKILAKVSLALLLSVRKPMRLSSDACICAAS